MAKQSGLGDNFYWDGYDLSGDVGQLGGISTPVATLDVTGINRRAHERIAGQIDGAMSFTSFWNNTTDASFDALKANLMTGQDRHLMYFRGTAIGSPAAALVSKRSELTWTRGSEGSLSAQASAVANGFGLDWGEQLTVGKRTDTTATNGASLNNGVSTAFGWQAYLQVFSFTGTSVTVTIQDSADNSSWATLTGAGFTAATGRTKERLQGARAATVRQYVRAITTGIFTNAVFAVVFTRNAVTLNL